MSPLDGAVELLDRALAYTRVALSEVSDADLDQPTPCRCWDLGHLLAHMEDALDAFSEGSVGHVALESRVSASVRISALQQKACSLLGAWSSRAPQRIEVGDRSLEAHVVVLAAALEITVHGWDVAQSTGSDHRIPPDLARQLLQAAETLVSDVDREHRFGHPRPVRADAPAADRLLGFLGRDSTGSAGQNCGDTCTDRRAAS